LKPYIIAGIVAAVVISSFALYLIIYDRCGDYELWDGYNCVSVTTLQEPCKLLTPQTQILCQDMIYQKVEYYNEFSNVYDLTFDEEKAFSQRVYAESIGVAELINEYDKATILCRINDFGSFQCVNVVSLLSFYDRDISVEIIRGIDGIYEIFEFDNNDDVLVDCGFGQWESTSIENAEGSSESVTSIVESFEDAFPDEQIDDIMQSCMTSIEEAGSFGYTFDASVDGWDPFEGMCGFDVGSPQDETEQFTEMVNNYNIICDEYSPDPVAGNSDPSLTPIPSDQDPRPDPDPYPSPDGLDNADVTDPPCGAGNFRGGDGDCHPSLTPIPKDCLDDTCFACQANHEVIGDFRDECVLKPGNAWFCQNIAGESECCSNPNAPEVNPGLIMPNPDGDMTCYSELDKEEAEAEECREKCGIMQGDGVDCDAMCSQTSRTLPFDPFREYCKYAEPLPGEECVSLRPPTIDVPKVPPGPPVSDFGKSIFIDLVLLR